MDHSELVLSASIDPYWRGYANFALADDEVGVEEAWFQSLSLGHGLSLKGGRFYSGLGYLNERLPHAWDFVDAPLMYQALFGERYNNDGLQLKWLAPTETFLEFGLEAGRGGEIVGDFNGNDIGAWTAFAKAGGDVGPSHSWQAGIAYLDARPDGREGHWDDDSEIEAETLFSGSSETWVADFVWKWAPQGNARERNFKFQAEYFWREESGDLSCSDNTAEGGVCAGNTGSYRTRQDGWYAQGVYQFMPRWRAGLRYDRLDSGSQGLGTGFAGVLSRPAGPGSGGKRVVVAGTRGGVHGDGPGDHQESYLRTVFGFHGIDNVEIVRAEGLALSPAHRAQALQAAHAALLPQAA